MRTQPTPTHLSSTSHSQAEILANEAVRAEIQARIDRLVSNNSNVAFLNLMRTFRLQVSQSPISASVALWDGSELFSDLFSWLNDCIFDRSGIANDFTYIHIAVRR